MSKAIDYLSTIGYEINEFNELSAVSISKPAQPELRNYTKEYEINAEERRLIAQKRWPVLVEAIEMRRFPPVPFKTRYPNGWPFEVSDLRESAKNALDLFVRLWDGTEEETTERMQLLDCVWQSFEEEWEC